MNCELEKLVNTYKTHGGIVVGLDFDNTIYPLNTDPRIVKRCERVRELIHKVRTKVDLCLWTVANDWSISYKLTICEAVYGIEFDAVNKSTLYEDPTVRKPYFNLLLDDSAGLTQSMDLLEAFNELIDNE
jgi:hypothetical protein